MKFLNINGQEYSISVEQYRKERAVSKPAREARSLLRQLFPCDQILEEVPIKTGRQTLYIDFFLPARQLVVEVNGEQHRTFNNFHYTDKHQFLKAKLNDKNKKEWCLINKLDLVVLDDNRQDEWESLISERDVG